MKFNQAGVIFMTGALVALSVFIRKDCWKNNSNSIGIEVESDTLFHDFVYVSFIQSIDDLYNGSTHLVIDTIYFKELKTIFEYDYHKYKRGFFRFNFYDKNHPKPSNAGSMSKMGSYSNYIFVIPEESSRLKIRIPDKKVQNYMFTNVMKSENNQKIYNIHQLFNSFRTMEDNVLTTLRNCKLPHQRDSIFLEEIPKLKTAFIDAQKEILESYGFEEENLSLFISHYFLQEFRSMQTLQFIQMKLGNYNSPEMNAVKTEINRQLQKMKEQQRLIT